MKSPEKPYVQTETRLWICMIIGPPNAYGPVTERIPDQRESLEKRMNDCQPRRKHPLARSLDIPKNSVVLKSRRPRSKRYISGTHPQRLLKPRFLGSSIDFLPSVQPCHEPYTDQYHSDHTDVRCALHRYLPSSSTLHPRRLLLQSSCHASFQSLQITGWIRVLSDRPRRSGGNICLFAFM